MKQIIYVLEWSDMCGGRYCHTFNTGEERAQFRRTIERNNRNGKAEAVNWKEWEKEVKQ